MAFFQHPQAIVETQSVGEGTTIINRGASIGANAMVLPGMTSLWL